MAIHRPCHKGPSPVVTAFLELLLTLPPKITGFSSHLHRGGSSQSEESTEGAPQEAPPLTPIPQLPWEAGICALPDLVPTEGSCSPTSHSLAGREEHLGRQLTASLNQWEPPAAAALLPNLPSRVLGALHTPSSSPDLGRVQAPETGCREDRGLRRGDLGKQRRF